MKYSIGKWGKAWAAAILLSALAQAGVGAETLVYATLEPKEIAMGESAQLTITNLGTDAKPPALPTVAGLQFEIIAHTHQFELTNGTTLPSSSVVVRVTPQIAGTFTIPRITPNGQSLVLHVTADHGVAGSSGPGNTNYLIRPPVRAIAPKNEALHLTDGAAFVRLNLPKRDVYVGESVPVAIEVGVRAGFVTALNGLPTLHGGEFTLNNLSHQPDREEKLIEDKHFTLLTWHSEVAAVKPGLFTLDVETPLTVRISTRPKQDSALDELLGDPFLQNYFGTTVSKQITVSSPAADLKVMPIPLQGRPADFGGAVGTFNIATDITPSIIAAGDPMTLRLRVSGTGNFDRVNSEMFTHLDDWKTYPAKASFHAGDGSGARGEKTFEQPLIAPQPGAHTLPPLAFSYFDPVARRFETVHSAPITINVSASPGSAAPASAGALAALPGLRPDHAPSAQTMRSLTPLYLRPAFLAAPSLATLAFAGGWLLLRRRAAPRGRPGSKTLASNFKRLDAALSARDATLFSMTARAILQELLASRWHVPQAQVTFEELRARLGAQGDELQQLFMLADEVRYGHQDRTKMDFQRWRQVLHRELMGETA